jgi:hypothetical protein
MRSLLIFCLLYVYTSVSYAQSTTVRITLYDAARYDNGLSASDGLLIAFEAGNNNGVDSFDAPKIFNLDESFVRQNGSHYLSIERRDIPVDNEVLPFFIINYRTQDYVFEVDAFQMPGYSSYIQDLYTGEIHEVGTGQTEEIRFSIDNSIPESIDVNRFQMTFIEKSDYIYDNAWINSDPCLIPMAATENLSVLSGTAIIDCDVVLNNLTISNGAILQIESGRTVTINGEIYNSGAIDAQNATVVLNGSSAVYSAASQLGNLTVTDNNNIELAGLFDIYGTLKHSGISASVVDNSNASITFKSSLNRNAYFIPTDLQLTSAVVSETYMSAKRAYRFLSSPVTTNGTIFENGYYLEPTVIEVTSNDCKLNQEEIFGPVVTIMPFNDEAHALELANGTKYGLSATLWTNNLSRTMRMTQEIEAGIVWVNTWLNRDLRTPFGGVKDSGVGREGGFEALDFFTEPKNVCIEY